MEKIRDTGANGFKSFVFNVCRFCVKNKAYLLSAFIPAAVLFASYLVFGVYPAGKRSVLALDLNAQYVYYYEYMYDVLAGRESLFYCWSRTLSGEFFGILAYYLASPFNFIVWLFPRSAITEGLLLMTLAKAAACGFTMSVLLKKHRGFNDFTAVMFSLMYALSGYFSAHSINPMWLDGMIALPLVIMGVERICDRKKFLLYILSLLYIFVANYYIGFMVGIFSLLYLAFYIASGKTSARGAKSVFKGILLYGVSSVSAILMSGFIVLPVYRSLQMGKLQMGDPNFELVENFNISDTFLKLFCGTFDTIRPEGFPNIFSGTAALIFAIIWFTMKRIPLRERASGGVLLGVLYLSMYVKPVDMLWHGGRVPVWMPYRYSFLIVFLLIMFGAETFNSIEDVNRKTIGGVFAGLAAVLLIADHYSGSEHYGTELIIVIPLVALGLAAGASAFYKRFHSRFPMKLTFILLVCAELFVNNLITFDIMDKDIVYSTRESYLGEIPETRSAANAVKELDDGFYRMEKTYHRCVNDPLAAGMYGLSHSTSTFNEKAIALVKQLGFGAREHYSRYDGATKLTDDILGVKYVLTKGGWQSQYDEALGLEYERKPYDEDDEDDDEIEVYINEDALGLAYLADKEVIGGQFYYRSPFDAQEELASELSGEYEEIFIPVDDYLTTPENLNVGSTTDEHISYEKRLDYESAYLVYTVTTPLEGHLYMYLPSDYERECYLYVNDGYIRNYFENENHCIAYLGYFGEGETLDVKLELAGDDMYCEPPQFRVLDEEALERFSQRMSELNENTSVKLSKSHTKVEISVDCEEMQALFTSIPYEDGWTATIDGKKVPILTAANSTLMCLSVPKGQHTIELSFKVSGLGTGAALTAGGCGLLAVMLVASQLLKTRIGKKSENASPLDGEE